jgi:segregation and condensation protein B
MSGAEYENGADVEDENAAEDGAAAGAPSIEGSGEPIAAAGRRDDDDDADDDEDDGSDDDSDDDGDESDDDDESDEDESDEDESDDEDASDDEDDDDESDEDVESDDDDESVDDDVDASADEGVELSTEAEDEADSPADMDADEESDSSADVPDEPELVADAGHGQGNDAPDGPRGDASDGDDEATDETAGAPPLRTILEAVLFAAAEPVPLTRLVKLLGAWPRAAVKEALDELGQALSDEGRGLRLAETAGGLQLRSAPDCAPWVRRFFSEKPPRLSRAVLETLAIVAYRQPATRGEVEAVRGVNCDAVLSALLTRNLIHVAGRRQSPGRPVEYGTTEAFLELFSLKDLGELPDLPEPEALARLIEEAEAQQELSEDGDDGDEGGEGDAHPDGANPEDLEPGGDRVAESGGGSDPGGQGPAEREGDLGARDEGGPEQG